MPLHKGHPHPETRVLQKMLKKGHNPHYNWRILPSIDLDLYLMIIYLCIKYESSTLIFSKDIEWKPFFVQMDRGDVRTDSGDTIWCPIENGRGIKKYLSGPSCSKHR